MKRSLVPKHVSLSFQIIPILGWKLSQVPLLKRKWYTFLKNQKNDVTPYKTFLVRMLSKTANNKRSKINRFITHFK